MEIKELRFFDCSLITWEEHSEIVEWLNANNAVQNQHYKWFQLRRETVSAATGLWVMDDKLAVAFKMRFM